MLKRKKVSNKENENSPSLAKKKTPRKKSILTENNNDILTSGKVIEIEPKSIQLPTDSAEDDNKSQTIKSLKEILLQKEFATDNIVSGVANELPAHIGLNIKDIGLVSLPLVEHQVLDLIKVSTIQDNIHEFKASQIEIKNPDWNRQLEILAKRAAKQLGCSNEIVNASLEHMYLYRQGACLLKRSHNSKNKNSFARLVIQLPSVYTGGEYLVYDGERKIKADLGQTSKKAAYALHFTAHMVDLEFEMNKIKSGNCLVLVYNLCSDEDFCRLMNKDMANEKLAKSLRNLIEFEKPIAILFEQQYTHKTLEGHLVEKTLKGIDKDRYKLLQSVNMQSNEQDQFNLYIVRADLMFQELGEKYHFIDRMKDLKKKRPSISAEEEEEILDDSSTKQDLCVRKSKTVTGWYNEKGETLFKINLWREGNGLNRVPLEFFSNIINLANGTNDKIQSWMFDNVDVNHRAGWDGYFFTLSYSRYMLVLWPKKNELELRERIQREETDFDNLVHQ